VQDGCLAWAVDRRGHYGWAQTSFSQSYASEKPGIGLGFVLDQEDQEPQKET
jgi:hypothetical protein